MNRQASTIAAVILLLTGCSSATTDTPDPPPASEALATTTAPTTSTTVASPEALRTWDSEWRDQALADPEITPYGEWVLVTSEDEMSGEAHAWASTATWDHGFEFPYAGNPALVTLHCYGPSGSANVGTVTFDFGNQTLDSDSRIEIKLPSRDMYSMRFDAIRPHYYTKNHSLSVERFLADDGGEVLVRGTLYDGSTTGIIRFSLIGVADVVSALGEHCKREAE